MPEIPGTGVFSLDSALGLSFSGGPPPEPMDLAATQSCYAVSGSFAAARNLSQRWVSGAASKSQEHVFVNSSGSTWQDIEPVTVPMASSIAAATGRAGGRSAGHVPAGLDACSHVYAALDIHQSAFPITSGIRYRTSIYGWSHACHLSFCSLPAISAPVSLEVPVLHLQ
jgi:hypothetical protein